MIFFHVQSAYTKFHSTETSILKLKCDALLAADNVTLLGLLDLSAAFDTVDHSILISRLQSTFGIHGTVLSWITYFITDRTQTVNFAGQQSTTAKKCCVEYAAGKCSRPSAVSALHYCRRYYHCPATWLSGAVLRWWYTALLSRQGIIGWN